VLQIETIACLHRQVYSLGKKIAELVNARRCVFAQRVQGEVRVQAMSRHSG
jgi:hypothetical protein